MLFGQIFPFLSVPLALVLDQNWPRPYKRPKNQLLNPLAFFRFSKYQPFFGFGLFFLIFLAKDNLSNMQEGHMQSLQDSEYCLSLEERNNYLGHEIPHDENTHDRKWRARTMINHMMIHPVRPVGLVLCLVLCLVVFHPSHSSRVWFNLRVWHEWKVQRSRTLRSVF